MILSSFSQRRLASRLAATACRKAGLGILCLLLAVPGYGVTHTAKARHARNASNAQRHFRLVKWNPLFPGSHELLVQQNEELDRLQLPRFYDDYDLIHYEISQDLVPVSETDALKIAADLPETRRYCRPWTRDFLRDFSQAFYDEFQTPIQVNSLVRTAKQQQQLRRHNRFAAPEVGETASTHLTGVTVDLSRRGLTKMQYQWMRDYLLPLQEAGMVNPIEERQPVLHVVVFEKYSDKNDKSSGHEGAVSDWSEASEPTEVSGSGMTGTQP